MAMLDFGKSYESVAEIYGGFPLKADFLDVGNVALAAYGVKADFENGVIRIPFVDRPCFTPEELREAWPENEENPDDWRIRLTACIELSENPTEGVADAYCESEFIVPDDVDDDSDYYLTDEEYNLALELIETFLNKAVDAE